MSTEYSLDLREQMTAEHGEEVPIHLLTFTHPDHPAEPLRLSTDRTAIISTDPFLRGTWSRGEKFVWLPMSLIEPDEGDDVTPTIRLKLNFMNEQVLAALRANRTPADVVIELISDVRPNHVEKRMSGFRTSAAPWEGGSANVVLSQRADDDEPYPGPTMNPITAKGLFR